MSRTSSAVVDRRAMTLALLALFPSGGACSSPTGSEQSAQEREASHHGAGHARQRHGHDPGTGGRCHTGAQGPVACLGVAPDGDDAAALSSRGATPFRNVQPAIDFAAANPNVGTSVCVAAGPTCGVTAEYAGPRGADLTMRDGIALLGNYESTSWTRCSDSVTRLLPATPAGVVFGSDIVHGAQLDAVEVVTDTWADTTAITVEGAQGVQLLGVSTRSAWEQRVNAFPDSAYGIVIEPNSAVTLARSNVVVPAALEHSTGLQSTDSHVVIEDSTVTVLARGDAVGISLTGAPDALIVRNSVSVQAPPEVTGVRLRGIDVNGDATNAQLSKNDVSVIGASAEVTGMSLGSSVTPRISASSNNVSVQGAGLVTGVISRGGLSAELNNVLVTASGPGRAVGLACGTVDGTNGVSACIELTRNSIAGVGTPSCDGCKLDWIGLWVVGSGALVDGNALAASCADGAEGTSFGIFADGDIRIQNNVAGGGNCAGLPKASMAGVAVGGDYGGTVDVNSNWLLGSEQATPSCFSTGITLLGGNALIRDNVLDPGGCGTGSYVYQRSACAPPLALENNDFLPRPFATFYRVEGRPDLTSIDQVNTLPGASGNFTAQCEFPLSPGSPCIDAGTPTGAPDHDMDGQPRDPDAPDVGPDEFIASPSP